MAAIADRRIALWTRLGTPSWRLERERLRFALGVSLADVRVPFQVGPGARRIVLKSAQQLALMLLARHKHLVPRDDYDRFLLQEEFGKIPPATASLAPGVGGAEVRATAQLAFASHPALTGAVVAAWLSPGGGGRSLVALVLDLLKRALAEGELHHGKEDTASLGMLILSTVLPAAEAVIRAVGIPSPVDRYLCAAAGTGVFCGLQLGIELAGRQARSGPESLARAESTVSPAVLLGGRAQATGGGGRLYGCELSAGTPGLDEALSQLVAGTGVEPVERLILAALDDAGDARLLAEGAVAISELAERVATAAIAGEGGALEPELVSLLRELATEPGRLPGLLADARQRKSFAKDLAEEVARVTVPDARAALEGCARAFKAWSERDPADAVGLSRPEARGRYARAVLALACDLALERSLGHARRALVAPAGTEAQGGPETEYEAGRLYRVSEQPEPLLKEVGQAPIAHLFVDVKDFTRRTALLGQAAMADFLRQEFYLPILQAARAYHRGLAHLEDRGGVSLNNLLGDAASLSGDVESMIGLARDIRAQLQSYQQRLAASLEDQAVAAGVKAIESEFQRKSREQGADAERLAADKEVALTRARGEGLEAGVFISYGPAPLVLHLEDAAFGRAKVAIADRINESARGTARAPGARSRADTLLGEASARTGNPHLRHPWRVFIGAPLSLAIPYDTELKAREAMRRQDADAAVKILLPPLSRALAEAAQRPDELSGDIYNAGVALSDEALTAFTHAVGARRRIVERSIDPRELHPAIHERFFLPPEPLRLVAAFHPDGRLAELFRFCGRALFKGFERQAGIGVWELVSEAEFGELFARYHA